MDYSKIPEELKLLKQWLCVKLVPVAGKKPRKVPVKDLRTSASVDDPNSWLSFDDAVSTVANSNGKLHHIGFVFAAQDPYCGVDLDDCVYEGQLSPDAQRIVSALDSYTETSVSGTGVHVVVKAEKKGAQCRKNKIEMYDSGRYFCFSGQVLDDRNAIKPHQDQLDALYDELWPGNKEAVASQCAADIGAVPPDFDATALLLDLQNKNGLLNNLLSTGDWSSLGIGSASDADYIVCCALAKATNGDAARMDAALRASKLMRPKWDEKRGALTYGQRTVLAAIAALASLAEAPSNADRSLTHDVMAKTTLAAWTARLAAPPINYAGQLWYCNKTLWQPLCADDITNLVAKEWDGKLKKHGDYVAVRKRMYEIVKKTDAAFNSKGFAFHDSIAITDHTGVRIEPLRPEHLVNHCATYAPTRGETPVWSEFLARSFRGVSGQLPLLQELMGLTLVGEMPRLQQCVLLHGPGATGKSVLLNLLTGLFPRELVCAVAPADWSKEYSRAEMAGKKINIAGELSSVRSIQSDVFKSIVAGDKIGARKIYEQTYTMVVHAAHWFSANELPSTEDHTSGWYRRFIVLQMPNAVPVGDRNTNLSEDLAKEKAGIAAWALDGAARYFMNGRLTTPVAEEGATTTVGIAVLDEWRAERDSVAAWAQTFAKSNGDATEQDFAHYRTWCFENSGQQPCNLQRFKSRLKSL